MPSDVLKKRSANDLKNLLKESEGTARLRRSVSLPKLLPSPRRRGKRTRRLKPRGRRSLKTRGNVSMPKSWLKSKETSCLPRLRRKNSARRMSVFREKRTRLITKLNRPNSLRKSASVRRPRISQMLSLKKMMKRGEGSHQLQQKKNAVNVLKKLALPRKILSVDLLLRMNTNANRLV